MKIQNPLTIRWCGKDERARASVFANSPRKSRATIVTQPLKNRFAAMREGLSSWKLRKNQPCVRSALGRRKNPFAAKRFSLFPAGIAIGTCTRRLLLRTTWFNPCVVVSFFLHTYTVSLQHLRPLATPLYPSARETHVDLYLCNYYVCFVIRYQSE